MLETLFFLDKILLKALISYFGNPINGFSTLCGLWLAAEVYTTKIKNNKKKGAN